VSGYSSRCEEFVVAAGTDAILHTQWRSHIYRDAVDTVLQDYVAFRAVSFCARNPAWHPRWHAVMHPPLLVTCIHRTYLHGHSVRRLGRLSGMGLTSSLVLAKPCVRTSMIVHVAKGRPITMQNKSRRTMRTLTVRSPSVSAGTFRAPFPYFYQ